MSPGRFWYVHGSGFFCNSAKFGFFSELNFTSAGYGGIPNKILHEISEELPVPVLHCTGHGHGHGRGHGHVDGHRHGRGHEHGH